MQFGIRAFEVGEERLLRVTVEEASVGVAFTVLGADALKLAQGIAEAAVAPMPPPVESTGGTAPPPAETEEKPCP